MSDARTNSEQNNMGVWQEVAMDSLKFFSDLPCPTLLRPAGGPPLKRPYTGGAAYGRLLPFWTLKGVRLCKTSQMKFHSSMINAGNSKPLNAQLTNAGLEEENE
jgi:hypothetical protein